MIQAICINVASLCILYSIVSNENRSNSVSKLTPGYGAANKDINTLEILEREVYTVPPILKKLSYNSRAAGGIAINLYPG